MNVNKYILNHFFWNDGCIVLASNLCHALSSDLILLQYFPLSNSSIGI